MIIIQPTQPKQRFRNIQLNRSSNQAKGLVLWYPLCSRESAAQPKIDYSGKGNHLQTTWSVTQNLLSYTYGYGQSMTFGGSGVSQVSVAPISAGVLAYYPGTDGVGDSGGDWIAILSTALNTTYHIAITGEGATLKHYVTPVGGTTTITTLTLSGTQAQPTAYSGSRYFGSNNTANARQSNISDLRVYNRALSASEVLSLYDAETRFELFKQPQVIIGATQQNNGNNECLWVGGYNRKCWAKSYGI